MNKALFAALSLASWGLGALAASAQGFIPYDQCAVVVASRPNLVAARAYIYEHGWENSARIFESGNGWFAISVEMIPSGTSVARLSAAKNSGTIPADAYCSTGAAYVREVAWQQAVGGVDRLELSGLWAEFDARPMTVTEKRFLQAALAAEGYYNGLLDGVWGNGSQGALERYTAADFQTTEPLAVHAAYLALNMIDRWLDEGWEFRHINQLGISMMLPQKQLYLAEKDGLFERWRHISKDLEVTLNDLEAAGLVEVHQGLSEAWDVLGTPYTLRSSDLWVTSVQTRTETVYVRSDLIAGTWSTAMVVAERGLQAEVGLISSSITVGGPTEIIPSEHGVLLSSVKDLGTFFEESSEPDLAPPGDIAGLARSEPSTPPDEPNSGGSTGTAFFVNDEGVALTNAHVVDGCSTVMLGGRPAEILNVSAAFDLAALKLKLPEETTPLHFSEDDVGLNADITIAGYPLHGLLGGLNVSRGSVSFMKGIGGDETSIQISAPVQPGNSGGPAIDRRGGVVGVVVSKLDAVALADATGDIAQNVNFAIRGSLAKVFLSSNGISYSENDSLDSVDPEKAAAILQDSTRLVECR